MRASGLDHPNGGRYETQEDRFGSSGTVSRTSATPQVKQTLTFDQKAIEELIVSFVEEHYGKKITTNDIHMEVRAASYEQYYSSPASVKMSVDL